MLTKSYIVLNMASFLSNVDIVSFWKSFIALWPISTLKYVPNSLSESILGYFKGRVNTPKP